MAVIAGRDTALVHADLVTALADHAAATDGWRALLRDLSPEQANWRPAPERWSIAQCLDHVGVVTEAVLPALEACVAESHVRGATSPGPFRYGWLGRWFLAAQAPNGGRGTRTPGIYRPSASDVDMAGAWARFECVQTRFGAVVELADGVDLARARAPSPAFALLRLPLGIWLLALPQHTLRHLAQARRVRDDARFPAFALLPGARRRLERAYATDIDDVYQRPNMPSWVGFLWPPRRTPARPAPLAELEQALTQEHEASARFFTSKDEALLGHVTVWDPAIGRLNLVQALRVGVHHDQHHYAAVRRILGR